MAEKVELFELNIKVEDALKNISATKIAIEQMKEESKRLKETEGDLSDSYIESQANLKVLQKELRGQERQTQNVIQANEANSGSMEQLRSQLSVVSAQWAKLSKDERENTEFGKKLTAQKLQLTNALKKEERATGDARRNVGNYNETMGQSVGIVGQFVPAVGKAGIAVQGLGKAFKLALGPIGLVVAAVALVVGSMKEFFTSSEEGQDAWDEFTSSIDVGVGNISDAFSKLGKKLSEPKKTIQELRDFFDRTFVQYWTGAVELLGAEWEEFVLGIKREWLKFLDLFSEQGAEIKKVSEEIAGAQLKIRGALLKMNEGIIQTKKAYEDAKKAAQEFAEEQLKEQKRAEELAKRQGNLNRAARVALVQNAKLERDIAKIRAQVADKSNIPEQERLNLLNDAIKLEEKILKNNLFIAQQEAFIAVERNKLSNSTREDLDNEAQKKAKVFQVEKSNFEKTRKLISERSALESKIAADRLKLEQSSAVKTLDILTALAQERENLTDDQALLADITRAEKAIGEERLAAMQVNYDNELALAQDNIFAKLELEREGLERQQAQEVEFAQKIGADTTLIEKKYANAREQISEAEQAAKLSLAAGFLGNIATIAGEGTGIAKAAAVAQTTVDTYAGATAAFRSLAGIPVVGPALGGIAAAAAVAAGLSNVKKILSVDSGLPGDNAGGGGGISASAPAMPQTPQGLSPDVNSGIISREQLASQQEINVQPTLVIDEVTAAQNGQESNNTTSTI